MTNEISTIHKPMIDPFPNVLEPLLENLDMASPTILAVIFPLRVFCLVILRAWSAFQRPLFVRGLTIKKYDGDVHLSVVERSLFFQSFESSLQGSKNFCSRGIFVS